MIRIFYTILIFFVVTMAATAQTSVRTCSMKYTEVEQEIEICQEEEVLVGHYRHDQAGTYRDTLLSSSGMLDSVVVTTIKKKAIIETVLNVEICEGETYALGGANYTNSGSYINVYSSVVTGCDSLVITNLTVHEPEDKQCDVIRDNQEMLEAQYAAKHQPTAPRKQAPILASRQ